MNAIFGSLSTEGLEEAQDRLGGFAPLDTDIYTGVIKMAYAGQSTGGARNVSLVVDFEGREYRETVYVTNRKGENFYLNPQDKSKKVSLPGFLTIEHLCIVTTGKPLNEQQAEEKVVKIYDPEARQELPTSVMMLTGLLGQTASFGIVKQLENKSDKVGDEYIPNAETRDTNVIDKIFHTETKLTVPEATKGVEEAVFWDAWVDKNKGVTRDKRTIKDGEAGQAGRPGAARSAPQASGGAPKKSLFSK